MAFEQNDNSGALFRNKDKSKDDPKTEKWADYQGNALIDGVGYWLSAWLKQDKNGNTYMSLAFKPKDEQPRRERPADIGPPGSNAPQGRRASLKDQLDDDIPF